jgi:hypothetical protein
VPVDWDQAFAETESNRPPAGLQDNYFSQPRLPRKRSPALG